MAANAHVRSGSPQKIPAVRGSNKPNAGGTDRTGQRTGKSAGRLSPTAAREEDVRWRKIRKCLRNALSAGSAEKTSWEIMQSSRRRGEVAAFALINLYYRIEGQWSDPVPGIGGNSFVAKEKSGFYTSDECYKMALTDALSVACKALGVAADVYWQADKTKYTNNTEPFREKADEKMLAEFYKLGDDKGRDKNIMSQWAYQNMGNTPENLTKAQLSRLIEAVKGW